MNVQGIRKRLSEQDYRGPALLWIIGILVAMSIPVPNVGTVDPSLGLDKFIHAFLFAGLGVLSVRALRSRYGDTPGRTLGRRVAVTMVGGVIFAAATEVYQHVLLPGRSGDPYDFIADVVGLVAAMVVYVLVRRTRFSTRKPSGPSGR